MSSRGRSRYSTVRRRSWSAARRTAGRCARPGSRSAPPSRSPGRRAAPAGGSPGHVEPLCRLGRRGYPAPRARPGRCPAGGRPRRRAPPHRLAARRRRSGIPALREARPGRGGQAQCWMASTVSALVSDRGDVRAAGGALVAERADVLRVGDPRQHGRSSPARVTLGGAGRCRRCSDCPLLHRQQVGAQRGRSPPAAPPGRRTARARHRHDRRDPDRDAGAGAEFAVRQPGTQDDEVGRPQPGRCPGRGGGHSDPLPTAEAPNRLLADGR